MLTTLRQGSWQYIATMILKRVDKVHNPLHDIESAFWVTIMCGLRYVPHHNVAPEGLQKVIHRIFDEHTVMNLKGVGENIETGGGRKLAVIGTMSHLDDIPFDHPAVEAFIDKITKQIRPTVIDRKRGVHYEYNLREKHLQTFVNQWSKAVKTLALDRPFCDRVAHQIEGYNPVDPIKRATMPSQFSQVQLEERRGRTPSGSTKRKASQIESGLDKEGVQKRPTRKRSSQLAPQTNTEQSKSNASNKPRNRSHSSQQNQDELPARRRSSSRISTRKK